MKLSEAIREGSKLRPESRRERFSRAGNTGVLGSDVWGAACEAVDRNVARRSWNHLDKFGFEADATYLYDVQMKHFAAYFQMPAQCPGAVIPYTKEGRRPINRKGETALNWKRDSHVAITTECELVQHLAGFIDHAFYAHGWSREQCAQAVEWYEQKRFQSEIVNNFQHYPSNSLKRKIAEEAALSVKRGMAKTAAKRRLHLV